MNVYVIVLIDSDCCLSWYVLDKSNFYKVVDDSDRSVFEILHDEANTIKVLAYFDDTLEMFNALVKNKWNVVDIGEGSSY